jgi:2-dehydro-3-deoxyphosphogluconate aldolase/(4S)-4-hydroxy-2-oxoglutarate aldolase
MLVGAGTVLTAEQADRAVEAGARFVVTPGFGPAVVRRCQELGVPVFPGVATATEIQMALDAGLSTVKFFPAEQLGGVAMVKALAAPFRSVRFIPTGGVNPGNIASYLAVPSVVAVGGTWMVAPDRLAAKDWAGVADRTRAALKAVEDIDA